MKKILCFCIIGIFFMVSEAQVEPLYFLRRNNNSIQYNPGSPTFREFYFGLGVSQLQLSFGSDFLTYNNLITKGDDGYKYLNTEALFTAFKDKKRNFISLDLHEELLALGFSLKKTYVSAALNLKSETFMRLPGEAFAYLLQGNADYLGYPVRSEMFVNSSTYLEFGLTLQRTFKDKFTFGIRPKYLIGLANAKTENAYLELFTDQDWNIYLQAQADAYLSIPDLDFISNQFGNGISYSKTMNYIRNCLKGNRGLGIDFGANAEFTKHIGAAVSITDLGYIRWRNKSPFMVTHYSARVNENSHYYKDGYLTFEGLNYEDVQSLVEGKNLSLLDSMENMLFYKEDTLSMGFSYTSTLSPKLMLEAHYAFTQKQRVYMLSRIDFNPEKVRASFSVAYSGQFASFFDLALSYSYRNQPILRHAIGLGANFHFSLFNFYLSLSNINLDFDKGYYQWKNLSSLALQVGVYCSVGERGIVKNKKNKSKK